MSHLIQEYAKSCGVKIGKPKLCPMFFPIAEEKYITIHHGSCPSTHYDYWGEVMKILSPFLAKKKIKVIQFVDDENQKINAVNRHITCSKKQAAFIIKNALCHVGTDSIYCTLAAEFKTPLVSIYSHTHPNNTRPWKSQGKVKELCSFEQVGRPTFDPNERQKSINSLYPETIAQSILDVLEIKKSVNFKTLFIGNYYNTECIDVIPAHPIRIQHPRMNVRMDIQHNEENLKVILQENFVEVTVIRPLSDEILSSRKIAIINYLAEEFDPEFVKKAKSLGIHINLLCISEKKLPEQRLKFFDHDVILHDLQTIVQENSKRIKDILNQKIRVQSNKKILIGDKQYSSYLEAFESKELFLLDLDWYYIYSDEHE